MGDEKVFNRKLGRIFFFIMWFWIAFFPPTYLPWSNAVIRDKTHKGWYFQSRLRSNNNPENSILSAGIDWGWVGFSSIGFILFALCIMVGNWLWPEEKHKFSEKILNEIMEKYGIKSRRKFVRTFTGFDTDENQYMKRSEIEKAAQASMGIEDE